MLVNVAAASFWSMSRVRTKKLAKIARTKISR